ncbi:hypothetical protein PC128_g25132 [Phytophthora cactorum]|nr:hypothetical protein PC128_g25132 [Phytophthora cactorum]
MTILRGDDRKPGRGPTFRKSPRRRDICIAWGNTTIEELYARSHGLLDPMKMMGTVACVRSQHEVDVAALCQVGNAPERKCSNDEVSASSSETIANEDSMDDPKLPDNPVEVVDSVLSVHSELSTTAESMEAAVATLEETYVSVARVLTIEGNEVSGGADGGYYEHPANKIGLDDYAKELAFLLDLTEESNTTIDCDLPNVKDPRSSANR